MLSAQNIKNKTFVKVMFGGYDTNDVQEFADEVASEFSMLQKENLALKEKFKELNDKNEEYKSVENSMRKALISAQNIANEMVSKAEAERDKILKDAQEIAHEQINTYRAQISEEQEKLRIAKEATSSFVSKITAFYEKQITEFVELSKELPASVKEVAQEEFTLDLSKENLEQFASINTSKEESITENILEKIKSETLNPKVLVGKPEIEEEICEIEAIEETQVIAEKPAKKLEHSSKFNFSELKFGKDYKND